MGTAFPKRNWPNGLLFEGRMVEITPLTIWAIVADSNESICAPEVIEQFRNLQQRMEDINTETAKHSLANISDYQSQLRDQLESAAHTGNLPDGIVMRSRDAIAEDFRAKLAALNKVLVKITHEELVPLAKPVFQNFERIVDQFLRDVELREREICDGFGIQYKPSVLWQAAVSVASQYHSTGRIPRPSVWITPKHLLDGIVEI